MHDRIRILFLSANPVDKGLLRLSEEVRAFDEKLRAGLDRDTFELIQQHTLRATDLQLALLRYQPQIVHFSGHRSLTEEIILEDGSGTSKPLTGQALAQLFRSFKDTVRIVFFDASFSKSQVEAISGVIDYIVGTNKAIGDKAAIAFAAAFYSALAFGRSVSFAFELAKIELDFARISGSTVELFIRKGVKPDEPILGLLKTAEEKVEERRRAALVQLASGNEDERSLIRNALIDGSVVLEQIEDVAETAGVDQPASDTYATDEVTRAGTKEDIRGTLSIHMGVSESGYRRMQEQLYPSPPGLLPPMPGLMFVGREDSLTEIKSLLCIGQEVQRGTNLTIVRGWPGVGKTTLVGVLARDPEIAKAFPDGVLWTALEQNPDLMSKIAAWGRALGTDDLLRIPGMEEATEKLGLLLHDKRILLIVDGIWDVVHALPFLRAAANSRCVLLATTRLSNVANALAEFDTSRSPGQSVYVLPVLTEEDALLLLSYLAPGFVEGHLDACRELIRDLECLPLALQVAGRLLNEEAKIGLDVLDLIQGIRDGAKLPEPAPIDRAEGAATPTVGALLRRSTDQLDNLTRDCFAYLGVFPPKPATFDESAMKAVWMVEDPKPMIRKLVGHGLLEPVGGGRFQIHALLVQHARSLFSLKVDHD